MNGLISQLMHCDRVLGIPDRGKRKAMQINRKQTNCVYVAVMVVQFSRCKDMFNMAYYRRTERTLDYMCIQIGTKNIYLSYWLICSDNTLVEIFSVSAHAKVVVEQTKNSNLVFFGWFYQIGHFCGSQFFTNLFGEIEVIQDEKSF